MKKLIGMMMAAACGSAFAGTCTYSFSWLKNNPVSDIQVPITLVEGEDGFSHTEFADQTAGSDLRVYVKGDDTPLPCEIEDWNREGRNPTEGCPRLNDGETRLNGTKDYGKNPKRLRGGLKKTPGREMDLSCETSTSSQRKAKPTLVKDPILPSARGTNDGV